MKKSVWISYNLGIKGDYQSLYEWLDNHEAKECGYSLVFLIYKSQGNKIKGKFIRGSRKKSPWIGYASSGKNN